MDAYFGEFWVARLLFERTLAVIYLIAFVAVLKQFPALVGESGFLPVPAFVKRVRFHQSPSLFHLAYSDRLLRFVAWAGIFLALVIVAGLPEQVPWWMPTATWVAIYGLYLSIVNVGQTFYSFGWESMLLEAGFFTAFLGQSTTRPSLIVLLALRWMLFRLMLGGGLIKLRHDTCWRHLTCLDYHFETQPLPNGLSWYFHRLPRPLLKEGVFFNHFVEVIAPFGLFGPQPVAAVAGILFIAHQLLLTVSGNFAFLNLLTIVLCLTAFSDRFFKWMIPLSLTATAHPNGLFQALHWALAVITVLLSIRPALNLLSRRQVMNASYNPWHIVNAYGMFGSITKKRYEIVIEGTVDTHLSEATKWNAYEFKAKPGDVHRRPPQIAPYHLRLDWLMWFLPFQVEVTDRGIRHYGHERWFVEFVYKLLHGDHQTIRLLGNNPFGGEPPRYIRALFYFYQFTAPEEKRETGAWWKRTLIGEFLQPVMLTDLEHARY